MSSIKERLLKKCIQWAEAKISHGNESLEQLNSSLEIETKSSMGDKYETSREMIQMEKNKITNQIEQALQVRQALHRINPAHQHSSVQLGSLVYTSKGNFYISAGIGLLILEDANPKEYMAISLNSPIGQVLQEGKTGDSRRFQDQEIRLLKVE